jgi:hypothetical protein
VDGVMECGGRYDGMWWSVVDSVLECGGVW